MWAGKRMQGDRQKKPNYGSEVDVPLGWNGKFCGFKLNVEASHIDVTPLSQISGDVIQLSGMVSRNFTTRKHHSLEPFFWVRHALPIKSSGPKQGTFLHEGLRYAWTGKGRFSLGSTIELMHDSGAFSFNKAFLMKAGLDGSWKMSKHWKLQFPAIRYSVPITHVTDGRKPQVILGGGIAYHY